MCIFFDRIIFDYFDKTCGSTTTSSVILIKKTWFTCRLRIRIAAFATQIRHSHPSKTHEKELHNYLSKNIFKIKSKFHNLSQLKIFQTNNLLNIRADRKFVQNSID